MLFTAAGLDIATFKPVEPQWVPAVFADERRAWEGPMPEHPDQTLPRRSRRDGGTARLLRRSTGPWSRSARAVAAAAADRVRAVPRSSPALVMPALMLAAAVLAWGNIKAGRGDRRGATRAAVFSSCSRSPAWLLGQPAYRRDRRGRRPPVQRASAARCSTAPCCGSPTWALEPYIRRFSPDSLIGWTRLLDGRWRDPQVASDVLLGVCAGLAMTLLYARPQPDPAAVRPAGADAARAGRSIVLLGARFVIGRILIADRRCDLVPACSRSAGVVAILVCRETQVAGAPRRAA